MLIEVERAGSEPPLWGLQEPDPLDRILLATDGTVTRLLESCTAEPIETVPLLHHPAAAVGAWNDGSLRLDPREFGLPSHAEVVGRRVVLQGRRSRVPYVLADSLLIVDRLPAVICDRLRRPGASLGRLLAEHAVESRRTILGTGRTRADALARHLACAEHDELAWRGYGIVISGRIAVLTLECFVPGRLRAVPAAFAADRS